MSRALALIVALSASSFGAGAADEVGFVETEIKGEIFRNGTPVSGLTITSCRDFKIGPKVQSECLNRIVVSTDKLGRFSFLRITGIDETAFVCERPCARDPSWWYWFSVSDGGRSKSFYDGGLGFGRQFVRVTCDLAESPMDAAELACKAIDVEKRAVIK